MFCKERSSRDPLFPALVRSRRRSRRQSARPWQSAGRPRCIKTLHALLSGSVRGEDRPRYKNQLFI